MAKRQYTIYLDMDGVICNFLGGFPILSKMAVGKSFQYDDYVRRFGEPQASKVISSVLKDAGISFWANLQPMVDYKLLIDYLEDNFMDIKILSSAEKIGANAEIGKREWLRKYNIPITGRDIIIVSKATDKKRYSGENQILIDDYEKNIAEWKQAGGIPIHHTSAINTIQKLKPYADFQSQNL